MSAWALGSTADPHAPMRTLREVRDDLRFRYEFSVAAGDPHGATEIARRIDAIEAEIARRNPTETPDA